MGKILGVKEIKDALRNRFSLLMLDRAEIVSDTEALGMKSLSINELFFQGHFPQHAIVPGVLQVDAMKQLCHVLVADRIDPDRDKDVYIRKLDRVKFRKPNIPGDRIKVEAKLIDYSNAEAVFEAKVSNSGGLTCEAVVVLATREKLAPQKMPELYSSYDINENTALNTDQIQKVLPHRFPFLLIDHVAEIEENRVVAIKNLTANEEIFRFWGDDHPVMPEAYMCEILAQAGCVQILDRPENAGKLGYFMIIDNVESLAPVYPGDQLVCDLELPPSKGRFGKGSGEITVEGKVVFKGSLMFAIVDP